MYSNGNHAQGRTYVYDDASRLSGIQSGGQTLAEYRYYSNGQRTHKISSGETFIYHYDQFGNLISETSEFGVPIREYLWQQGEPIAQIDIDPNSQVDTINYIHTDHLTTPRLATDQNQSISWAWESMAFGNSQPQSSSVTINLRNL